MNEFYFIGQVDALGKNGFVRIISTLDKLENYFQENKIIFLDFWGKKKEFTVEETLKVKNSFFVKFVKFDDDREAQVLIGRRIFSSEIGEAESKNFDNEDLIDCKVYQNNILIGSIKNVFIAPANNVIEILKQNGEEMLLPVVDAFFDMMDVKNKKLVLKPDISIDDDED